MKTQLQLFEPPPRIGDDLTGLSAQQRRTVRQARRIEQGIHPMMNASLLGGPFTCGDCREAHREDYHTRGYWKCRLFGSTHGAGSDLRLWWPACTEFAITEEAHARAVEQAKSLPRPWRPVATIILNERGMASL